ncbi:MAG: cytochrome ubiquinol oxidase subunit I, partial [Rhodobacteraceae bacterium]|nr:cytochrome ubiquinol oxidase subunit I [Paracoccaceae bacterium]
VPLFFALRVMVGIGLLMLIISWTSVWYMRSKAGPDALPKPLLYLLVPMAGAGWLATLAGWYLTEIGRQPWLVHGVLTTKAAVGDVPPTMVLSTLIAYLIVYGLLLVTYIGVVFYLARKAALGDKTIGAPEHGRTIPAE